MRFSDLFDHSKPQRDALREQRAGREKAPEPRRAAGWQQDLPDDLDARVRLVGEWQLGED